VVADFLTQSYRISGSVDVSSRKLADRLEDRTSSFLQLENAYISNIEHPADIVASHTIAILRKEKIIAAVVSREEDGLSRKYTYGSYLGTRVQRAFLIVPAFEIQGYLRFSGTSDLRATLTSGDRFLPVLDAEMKFSVRPDITFAGGVILVNRGHIEALWEVEEPTDG
jgi:hypothetical protein